MTFFKQSIFQALSTSLCHFRQLITFIMTLALINPAATKCGSISGWNMTYFPPQSLAFN